MFSLINLILSCIILIRLYKYDKFYLINYGFDLKEMPKEEKNKRYRNGKQSL